MLPMNVAQDISSLCSSLNSHLPDVIDSVYLYGSIALPYIDGSSDIDFIAVVSRQLTLSDIQAIADVHHKFEQQMIATDMMGSYMLREDLGKAANEIPNLLTYYGKKVHTGGAGADLNPVTWAPPDS